jgi:N-acetylneuraminate synthase
MTKVRIGDRLLGIDEPTYFIADIAANHDGDLDRALELITLAAQAGADAAKFQHFRAAHIVSDYGFRSLGGQLDHQATWSKSVFEVYQDASLPWEWTPILAKHCAEIGIEFMSSPYDVEAVEHLDLFVNAYKVGSGDVNWLEELAFIASKGKPVIIATGAATLHDVHRAMSLLTEAGVPIVLMQCNTNYTGSAENLGFVNLLVLEQFATEFPGVVLGLSDHTPGHVTTLGAVALGARVIEKHFTDDTARTGPDHGFSMSPKAWRDMVVATRELEYALGNGIKKIEDNERHTAVLQRRAIRLLQDLPAGTVLTRDHVTVLRPCPADAISPMDLAAIPGKKLMRDITSGDYLRWNDLA